MQRTLIKKLSAEQIDQDVCVKGWLKTRRDSKGGFSFLKINDGSRFGDLQIVADSSLDNYDEITKLYVGASLSCTGKLVVSQGNEEFELQATSIKIYGNTDKSYPLQKGRISFEKLREIAHLRPRTNTFGAVTRVRNVLSKATHDFFQNQDFINLHTPIITASDCEGAGEMFQVTTMDMNKILESDAKELNYKRDFFQRPSYLTVSGQLNAETYACALGSVYTFGPTFRAENSNTSRHLAEFWMVEPEMSFADLDDDADLAEAYLKYCFKTVLEECSEDLAFFNKQIDKGLVERLEGIVESEFKRLTYTEAVELLIEADADFEYPVKWGIDLQSEHERFLSENLFKRPVIVTDYPKDIKAFYMKMNDDGKTVRAMDVLCPGIGEIIGGSQREDDLEKLEKRLKEMNLDPEDFWWYLDLRRYGTVPHAGFGLGFERLVQFCTGMANIRDVIPFPRTPKHADF